MLNINVIVNLNSICTQCTLFSMWYEIISLIQFISWTLSCKVLITEACNNRLICSQLNCNLSSNLRDATQHACYIGFAWILTPFSRIFPLNLSSNSFIFIGSLALASSLEAFAGWLPWPPAFSTRNRSSLFSVHHRSIIVDAQIRNQNATSHETSIWYTHMFDCRPNPFHQRDLSTTVL